MRSWWKPRPFFTLRVKGGLRLLFGGVIQSMIADFRDRVSLALALDDPLVI